MDESVSLGHTKYSQDSRWSSQFNGLENTNCLFDVDTGKLVSVCITLKSRAGREKSFTQGSNMMESNGLERIADDLQEHFGDEMISICHDGDNKSTKIYEKAGLHVDHHRDGGHGFNSIKKAFKKFKIDFYIKYGKRPYGSLDARIFRFAGYLLAKVTNRNTRASLWKNVPNHLQRSPGRPCLNPCSIDEDFEVWGKGTFVFHFIKSKYKISLTIQLISSANAPTISTQRRMNYSIPMWDFLLRKELISDHLIAQEYQLP